MNQYTKPRIVLLFICLLVIVTVVFLLIRNNSNPTSADRKLPNENQIAEMVDAGNYNFLTRKTSPGKSWLEVTDEKGNTKHTVSPLNQYVIFSQWSDDKKYIVYGTLGEEPKTPDTLLPITVRFSNADGTVQKELVTVTERKLRVKLSPNNATLAIASPTGISIVNLETKENRELQTFAEFIEEDGLVYAPEPFWNKESTEVNVVMKKRVDGNVTSESIKLEL